MGTFYLLLALLVLTQGTDARPFYDDADENNAKFLEAILYEKTDTLKAAIALLSQLNLPLLCQSVASDPHAQFATVADLLHFATVVVQAQENITNGVEDVTRPSPTIPFDKITSVYPKAVTETVTTAAQNVMEHSFPKTKHLENDFKPTDELRADSKEKLNGKLLSKDTVVVTSVDSVYEENSLESSSRLRTNKSQTSDGWKDGKLTPDISTTTTDGTTTESVKSRSTDGTVDKTTMGRTLPPSVSTTESTYIPIQAVDSTADYANEISIIQERHKSKNRLKNRYIQRSDQKPSSVTSILSDLETTTSLHWLIRDKWPEMERKTHETIKERQLTSEELSRETIQAIDNANSTTDLSMNTTIGNDTVESVTDIGSLSTNATETTARVKASSVTTGIPTTDKTTVSEATASSTTVSTPPKTTTEDVPTTSSPASRTTRQTTTQTTSLRPSTVTSTTPSSKSFTTPSVSPSSETSVSASTTTSTLLPSSQKTTSTAKMTTNRLSSTTKLTTSAAQTSTTQSTNITNHPTSHPATQSRTTNQLPLNTTISLKRFNATATPTSQTTTDSSSPDTKSPTVNITRIFELTKTASPSSSTTTQITTKFSPATTTTNVKISSVTSSSKDEQKKVTLKSENRIRIHSTTPATQSNVTVGIRDATKTTTERNQQNVTTESHDDKSTTQSTSTTTTTTTTTTTPTPTTETKTSSKLTSVATPSTTKETKENTTTAAPQTTAASVNITTKIPFTTTKNSSSAITEKISTESTTTAAKNMSFTTETVSKRSTVKKQDTLFELKGVHYPWGFEQKQKPTLREKIVPVQNSRDSERTDVTDNEITEGKSSDNNYIAPGQTDDDSFGFFTCPTIFGFYPDAINCGQFYICSWSIPYHFDCPVGTVWNTELTVCDWPFNVNCGTRPWFGRTAFEKHFLPRQL